MKRAAALLAAAAWAAAGADVPQNQVRGREIVNQALQALGGDKFLAMENRVESGRFYSFYREQLSGLVRARIYTRYAADPKPEELGLRERQSFGKKEEEFASLFTEKEALQVTFRGLRPFPMAAYERYKDTAMRNIFYLLRCRLKEPGLIFEFRETTVIENSPLEVVDITDSQNRVVSVYFHRTTHLPMRQVFRRRDPETRNLTEETTIYNKYRESSGVMWPWSVVRTRDGSRVYEMYSDGVDINTKLDPALFEPSPTAKRLKPE